MNRVLSDLTPDHVPGFISVTSTQAAALSHTSWGDSGGCCHVAQTGGEDRCTHPPHPPHHHAGNVGNSQLSAQSLSGRREPPA